MTEKDHSNITLAEALQWARENTAHNDVCKRLRSRAVVRKLLQRIEELENAKNPAIAAARRKNEGERSIPKLRNYVRTPQVWRRLGKST